MRAVLNICITLIAANVLVLFCMYSISTTADDKEAATSLSKLISAYSEPNSNPQFLVRDENQCRFWGQSYCARALAKRKSVLASYSFNPAIPEGMRGTALFQAYVETRKILTDATSDYVAFLNTNPDEAAYIEQSKQFEEQTGVLVGQLVSYLYDMQGRAIARQTLYTERILMCQYASLVVLMFLVCLLRFRRGVAFHG